MTRRTLLIFCLSSLIWSGSAAPTGPSAGPAARHGHALKLRSGRLPSGDSPAEALGRARTLGLPRRFHAVVSLEAIPTPRERQDLTHAGVRLHGYLPDFAFHATVSADLDPADPRLAGVNGIRILAPREKMAPGLPSSECRGGSACPQGVLVRFHDDIPRAERSALVRRVGGIVAGEADAVATVAALVEAAALDELAGRDEVAFIEPALPLLTGSNDGVRAMLGIASLWNDPIRALNGAGVDVLVFDQGQVDPTHPDLSGRVVSGDAVSVASHSTHVAGTLAGNGALSSGQYAGVAPGARVISYALSGFNAGIFMYSNPGDLQSDFAAAVQTHGADLANLSLGSNIRINNYPCSIVGDYGPTDALLDAIATGSLGPRLPIVVAGGNERPNPACERVYATTTPPAGAKNLLSVGALNTDDGTVLGFSAWGPTDDGRLKPDVMGPGCEVHGDRTITSTLPGSTYGGFCGTSMASPAVTGALALLVQDQRARSLPDPGPALLRGLAYHTALDLELPGPDYATGFGRVNPRGMLDELRGGTRLTGALAHGESRLEAVVVTDPNASFKATLVWDDPPASAGAAEALVNDLDLRVIDPSGTRRFPWILDPANPSAAAIPTAEDHINNVEQVAAPAQAGVWRVEVAGSRVASGASQEYVLLLSTGPAAPPQEGTILLDRDVYRCNASMAIALRDPDLAGLGSTSVDVTSTSDPGGTAVTLNELSPPGSFGGTVTLGSSIAVVHGDSLTVSAPGAGVAHAAVDCVPPVISAVTISGLSSRAARLSWFTDEPADSRYQGQVLSSGRSLQHAVPLAALSPCTAYAPTFGSADAAGNLATAGAGFETLGEQARFTDAFETGAPGWQNPDKGGGGNVIQWQLTSSSFASPIRAWTDSVGGNYRDNSENELISPPVDLRSTHDAVVRFNHRYAIEQGYDAGFVDWSLDGNDWVPAASFSGQQTAFQPAEVALPPEARGPQVRVRFRLKADNSLSFDGWYVDDVQIVARLDCSEVEGFDVDLVPGTGIPRLTWLPSPSASSYDIVRGILPVAGVYGTCLAPQVQAVQFDDVAATPGVSYFYLVAGQGPAGHGTLGTNSNGTERPGPACP